MAQGTLVKLQRFQLKRDLLENLHLSHSFLILIMMLIMTHYADCAATTFYHRKQRIYDPGARLKRKSSTRHYVDNEECQGRVVVGG